MNDERSRDSAEKIAADRSFLSDDELIRRITAFADEGSGIGELRAKATELINAYDEAKDTGGHYLWQAVERSADALRTALSQSS